MTILLWGAMVSAVIVVSAPLLHLIRLHLAKRFPPTTAFSVAVIVPCKGNDDPDFENNLLNIVQQDYDGQVQFIFAAESEEDTAVTVLRSLEQRFERVQVCIAGFSKQCAQKTFNVLKAMELAKPDTEVFVIADADIQPHTTWLQELVAPFQDPKVGAATGFFRRIPMTHTFRLGDYLAGQLSSFMIIGVSIDRLKTLWGGSLAVRKAIMDKHNLYNQLATEIVDDIAIMHALHQHNIERRYVQSCTLKSYCDMTVKESIEWFLRQVQFIQIYFKALYAFFFVVAVPFAFYVLLTPFLLLYGIVAYNGVAVGVSLLFWVLLLIFGALLYIDTPINPSNVSQDDLHYNPLLWVLTTPMAFVWGTLALMKTWFRVKNKILTMRWRNITYRVDVKTGKVMEVIR